MQHELLRLTLPRPTRKHQGHGSLRTCPDGAMDINEKMPKPQIQCMFLHQGVLVYGIQVLRPEGGGAENLQWRVLFHPLGGWIVGGEKVSTPVNHTNDQNGVFFEKCTQLIALE